MNSITASFKNLLGARDQPSTPTKSAPVEVSSTDKKGTSSTNKMAILMGISVVVLGGGLFGLRQFSTHLRGMRVTPSDPNLNRTVKTSLGKSSMVSSVESELNNKNLNGQEVNPEVSLIAGKWKYKPIGAIQPKKLIDTEKVKATIPVATSAVVAPTLAVTSPKERVVVKTVYPKTKRHKEPVASSDDPFNTVVINGKEIVSTSAPSVTPATVTNSASSTEGTRFIPAAVYGKQMVRSSGKVRFRTLESVTFQGVYIPRNTVLTAIAYVGSGRIQFQVPARIVAGQKLPSDLMCVDKDYQTGISYNYDYVDDNVRQVSSNTVNSTADAATSYLPYGSALGVAGSIGSTAVRGITNAITSGKRQRSMNQVEIEDGYQVYFKSTKN